MYSNIKVYQKYLVTSIQVGRATSGLYASSGPKAEGVPTNNQSHIVPIALLVRVQRFRNLNVSHMLWNFESTPYVAMKDNKICLK